MKNKGITLVALVVTIIILLILAGITISQLTGSNLFENAKLAKEKYENSQAKEDDILKQYENSMNGGKISSDRDIDIQQLKNQIKQELIQEMATGYANPTGTIIAYSASTVPTGYLECNGQVVSRTTYSDLFAVIGTTYGAGDGETTFKVPDLRGEFLRGAGDNSRTTQGDGGEVGEHQNATAIPNFKPSGGYLNYPDGSVDADETDSEVGGSVSMKFNSSSSSSGWSASKYYTSRPTNTSVLYCIKY